MVDKIKNENRRTASRTIAQERALADTSAGGFEKLLADLSSVFVRASVDEIDDEIEHWLERIVLAMGVDRSTVVQSDPQDGQLYITHQWAREGVSALPRSRTAPPRQFSWLVDKVYSGEVLVISRVDDLPPEASTVREAFRLIGNKSNLTVPLRVGGLVVGALLFGAIVSEKHWSEQDVQRLKLVAEILGNALERKRAEAEIRRPLEELRQSSQVMALGELTASLAHELNQPLGAILNNAKAVRRLLTAASPDLSEINEALEDIIRDDARAVDIVKNVRAMFMRGEVKMSTVDVQELLLDVARIVGADARTKRISCSTELPDSPALVRGNQTHLTQAVLNLVMNAFDSVCDSEGPRKVTLLAARDKGDEIRVSVRDSGKGIDPAAMPRLFEPFFTTKPSGMGMGLTIVRSIVENHGGRIWATPNSDCGATLQFTLPVDPASTQSG
ncbi:MAG: GAF domain-containing protein [Deltaproteobacteria bacterium]|nr:GAF domain-containing protein [Deltaproteobacteria bacterium]